MSGIAELLPAVWLVGAAGLISLTGRRVRSVLAVGAPLVVLVLLLQMEKGTTYGLSFAGLDLIPFELGRVNFVFGVIFLLISSLASIYAWHIEDRGQQVAAMLYGAGALGVTFAGDFSRFWCSGS